MDALDNVAGAPGAIDPRQRQWVGRLNDWSCDFHYRNAAKPVHPRKYESIPNIAKIVTHSGQFHCDETCAVALLLYVFPNATVVRTRDPDLLAEALEDRDTVVVDVGKVYDPKHGKFDHHQAAAVAYYTSEEKKVPLSSLGMVWERIGPWICWVLCDNYYGCWRHRREDCSCAGDYEDPSPEDLQVFKKIADRYYADWVRSIDANDNGITIEPWLRSSLPSIIGAFNGLSRDEDTDFRRAADVAGQILHATILATARRYFDEQRTKEVLEEAFETEGRHEAVLELSEQITELDREVLARLDPEGQLLYVIVPRRPDDYRIWTIERERFKPRRRLPAQEAFAGVEGFVFVHATGYTGGAKTREAARRMTEIALA